MVSWQIITHKKIINSLTTTFTQNAWAKISFESQTLVTITFDILILRFPMQIPGDVTYRRHQTYNYLKVIDGVHEDLDPIRLLMTLTLFQGITDMSMKLLELLIRWDLLPSKNGRCFV